MPPVYAWSLKYVAAALPPQAGVCDPLIGPPGDGWPLRNLHCNHRGCGRRGSEQLARELFLEARGVLFQRLGLRWMHRWLGLEYRRRICGTDVGVSGGSFQRLQGDHLESSFVASFPGVQFVLEALRPVEQTLGLGGT